MRNKWEGEGVKGKDSTMEEEWRNKAEGMEKGKVTVQHRQ